ncbi:hypothetical protein V8E54_009281 [Elaphomyces granulatus]
MTSLQELKEECKALGLSTGGKKSQLTQRLNIHKASIDACSRPECEYHVNSIVAKQIELQDDDGMVTEARVALGTASQHYQIQTENIRRCMFVGNEEGLSFAEKSSQTQAIEQELSSLKERFRAEQEKRDAEQARREDERDHLLGLINVTTLNEMRNRFLSTYKRDKTASQLNSLDKGWISGGHLIAHGGNSKYDATLYSKNGRADISVYKQLYGLHLRLCLRVS